VISPPSSDGGRTGGVDCRMPDTRRFGRRLDTRAHFSHLWCMTNAVILVAHIHRVFPIAGN